MADPSSWKEFDPSRSLSRNVSLLVYILFSHLDRIGGKFLLDGPELSDREAINGCLPQTFEGFYRIAGQYDILGVAKRKKSSSDPVITRSKSKKSTTPDKDPSFAPQSRDLGHIPRLVFGIS